MKDYIYKLREKPEHIRKQYMVIFLVVTMSVVLGIWIYGLTNRFDAQVSVNIDNDIKPFTLFGESIKNTYSDLTASAADSLKNKTDSNVDPHANQKLIPLTVVNNPQQ
ncbi:MAG: hypothetical protein NTX85_03665 [Candidatus Nomurabacteria bacterium]|nr:hypothetical protein [Candidatus Nomurabacteria bacterium]